MLLAIIIYLSTIFFFPPSLSLSISLSTFSFSFMSLFSWDENIYTGSKFKRFSISNWASAQKYLGCSQILTEILNLMGAANTKKRESFPAQPAIVLVLCMTSPKKATHICSPKLTYFLARTLCHTIKFKPLATKKLDQAFFLPRWFFLSDISIHGSFRKWREKRRKHFSMCFSCPLLWLGPSVRACGRVKRVKLSFPSFFPWVFRRKVDMRSGRARTRKSNRFVWVVR